MARTILDEAVADAKLLKESAIENAKNVLVEAISPKIKEFVDSQLGETPMMMNMPSMMQPQVEAGMYEKHDDEEKDVNLMKKLGLVDDDGQEKEEEEEDMEENAGMTSFANLSGMGMAEGEKKDDEDKENLDEGEEVVEVTNEDLKAALSEALAGLGISEAHVTKGFGAVQDPTPKNAGGKAEMGLADEKTGEHHWKDETPPEAKDWTVKESLYRKKIESLTEENKVYKQAYAHLKRNLQEVNLFNSKLLYTNKLLNGAKLNNELRLGIIEALDRAQSIREVQLVYKSLSESLKIAGVLAESKQSRPSMKGPKASRYVTPSSTVLNESANKESGNDEFAVRMQQLAGLVD